MEFLILPAIPNRLIPMRIVYIDIDSLRPDHLGCYGYHRATSPSIDAIAEEGTRFDEYYVSDAPCLPSRTAFYSGQFGIRTGVVGHGGTAAAPRIQGARRGFTDIFGTDSLPSFLQRRGFHTTVISTFAQRHGAHWFYAGFNEIHNLGKSGMENAGEVWSLAGPWLNRHARSDNWFLHVNFWDPHTPYRTPAAFGDPFASEPLPAWLGPETFAAHQRQAGPHTALDIGMYEGRPTGSPDWPRHSWSLKSEADLRKLIDGYDTGVKFADAYVGKIVAELTSAGVYDDTAIIISADHGENLGELGIYAEHGTADAPTCKVPLIVKWPGGRTGVNKDLHYHLDLAPTLASLLGASPSPHWNGRSFAAAVKADAHADPAREELVLSQCAHVAQRSVRWGRWIYIRTYHDGFRLLPPEMVFDLEEDPFEQVDLSTTRSDLIQEGAWRLARWHAEQMQGLGSDRDPLWTVLREGGPFHARLTSPGNPGSPEAFYRYLERLEGTGRAEGAARLWERYAQFLPTNFEI